MRHRRRPPSCYPRPRGASCSPQPGQSARANDPSRPRASTSRALRLGGRHRCPALAPYGTTAPADQAVTTPDAWRRAAGNAQIGSKALPSTRPYRPSQRPRCVGLSATHHVRFLHPRGESQHVRNVRDRPRHARFAIRRTFSPQPRLTVCRQSLAARHRSNR